MVGHDFLWWVDLQLLDSARLANFLPNGPLYGHVKITKAIYLGYFLLLQNLYVHLKFLTYLFILLLASTFLQIKNLQNVLLIKKLTEKKERVYQVSLNVLKDIFNIERSIDPYKYCKRVFKSKVQTFFMYVLVHFNEEQLQDHLLNRLCGTYLVICQFLAGIFLEMD